MKVSIFGTGYVGLVTGSCLAEVGHNVFCIDVDQNKIDNLKKGVLPIWEPGLENIVERNVSEGRLHFTTDAAQAIEHGEIQIIAVGTPPSEDGSADLQHVLKVAETIAKNMQTYKVVVNKSTVPVGSAKKVQAQIEKTLNEREKKIAFDVVSNPEFLKEGAAVGDFMKPDRIIIGTKSLEAKERMIELYEPFNRNHERTIFMDVESAELTKYAANAMLATKISFMNELANIAEILGADIEQVRNGMGADPRIGYHFIYPDAVMGEVVSQKMYKPYKELHSRLVMTLSCSKQPKALIFVRKTDYLKKSSIILVMLQRLLARLWRYGVLALNPILMICEKHRVVH